MELHVNLIFRIIEKMYTITVELELLVDETRTTN
jgi:hypothetical protein